MLGGVRLTISGCRDVVMMRAMHAKEFLGAASAKSARERFSALEKDKIEQLSAKGMMIYYAQVPKAGVGAAHVPCVKSCFESFPLGRVKLFTYRRDGCLVKELWDLCIGLESGAEFFAKRCLRRRIWNGFSKIGSLMMR